MSAKIKYLSKRRRIKISRHLIFGERYLMQIKVRFMRWHRWKIVAWTYPENHRSYEGMLEYLFWEEENKKNEKAKRNFYGYNPLSK